MYKVTTYLNEARMPYLVKRKMRYSIDTETRYNSPGVIYNLCQQMKMTKRATEMVLLLIFDSANHLICVCELSTGSVNRTMMSAREVAQTMLLAGGVSCAIIHNHPSGDTEPSNIDISLTIRIRDALQLLDLKIVDHIIVGRNNYTSLAEKGIV